MQGVEKNEGNGKWGNTREKTDVKHEVFNQQPSNALFTRDISEIPVNNVQISLTISSNKQN